LVSGVNRTTWVGLPARFRLLTGLTCQSIMQKVRGRLDHCSGRRVAGSLSALLFKVLCIFSLTVLFAIAHPGYLNLEGGPPLFERKSLYSALLAWVNPPDAPTGLSPGWAPLSRGVKTPTGPLISFSLTTTHEVSVDLFSVTILRCFSSRCWGVLSGCPGWVIHLHGWGTYSDVLTGLLPRLRCT